MVEEGEAPLEMAVEGEAVVALRTLMVVSLHPLELQTVLEEYLLLAARIMEHIYSVDLHRLLLVVAVAAITAVEEERIYSYPEEVFTAVAVARVIARLLIASQ